jgi:uncharacterized protein YdeI (YjbR/CyaY-like superfamily)
MNTSDKLELKVLSFSTAKTFNQWLTKNHDATTGIWIKFFKKGSGEKTITYAEALDEALCFGWIDGQIKKFDEQSWIRHFTPRGEKSIWSKRNTGHAERLVTTGRMKPPGLKQVEKAKADGRWTLAYDSPANMEIPEDLIKAISKNKKAKSFFESLNKANLYSIGWRLQTAKRPETREKRIKAILEMLAKGQKFH